MIIPDITTQKCYLTVLPNSAARQCHPIVLYDCATQPSYQTMLPNNKNLQCRPTILPDNASKYCYPAMLLYLTMLPNIATRFYFPILLPNIATRYYFPILHLDSATQYCYPTTRMLPNIAICMSCPMASSNSMGIGHATLYRKLIRVDNSLAELAIVKKLKKIKLK